LHKIPISIRHVVFEIFQHKHFHCHLYREDEIILNVFTENTEKFFLYTQHVGSFNSIRDYRGENNVTWSPADENDGH